MPKLQDQIKQSSPTNLPLQCLEQGDKIMHCVITGIISGVVFLIVGFILGLWKAPGLDYDYDAAVKEVEA